MRTPTPCPDLERLAALFVESGPEHSAWQAHQQQCARCQQAWVTFQELTADLALPVDVDETDVARAVMEQVRRTEHRWAAWRRSWSAWLLAPAAAAAMVVISVLALPESEMPLYDPNTEGFAARSGSASLDRWVSLQVFETHRDGTGFERVQGAIAADAGLLFAFENRKASGLGHLMIFGVDAAGDVFWYHPAFTSPSENPTSLAIEFTQKPRELMEAVEHDLKPGWLRVFGLFTTAPMDVANVEALVDESLKVQPDITQMKRIPVEKSGQHTFLLHVE